MLQEILTANLTTTPDPTLHLHARVHDEQLYDVPVGLLVVLSILYGTISLLAVIGNTLVIWIVATTRQMQSVTNLFIANLALADVIIGMFAIPFQFHAAVLQRWILPEFMCAFCPYVQLVSVNVSVFTLTAIAVDRHRAIINPLRARPPKYVCKISICLIWIVSLVAAVPIAIALRVVDMKESITYEDGETVSYTKPFCDNVNLSWEYMQHYRYAIVLFQYMVPLCVISFVYIQMAVRLWGSKTPGNAQDSRDVTLMRNKKRVIKMLIIVVLLFGLCWFPLQLYQVLQVTFTSINEYRYINIVWFCSDWLAMSNSCYNPFIYGIYNEKFKREFQRRFPIFRPVRPDPSEGSDQTMSVYTRASSVRSTTAAGHHAHNNNSVQQQQQQRKALYAIAVVAANSADSAAATQRSSSFNFIGNGVHGGSQTPSRKHQSPPPPPLQQRSYPKVMFQHVPDAAPIDDDDIADSVVAVTSHGDCFEKPKRYADEYVQL